MSKPVVLCIDDEPTVLNSLRIELRKAIGDKCVLETAQSGNEALELLQELLQENTEVALVISDYVMPDMAGDELLKLIHLQCPNTPKIMLTGQANLEAVQKAMKYARLYRYIAKPWEPEDLKLTVVEAINSYFQNQQIHRQTKQIAAQNRKLQQMNRKLEQLTLRQAEIIARRTAELEEKNQELRRLAITDSLTGVSNRRHFEESLEQEWQRMAREAKFISLILCDIDYFKIYNDKYGHQQGDVALAQVARAINESVKRPADLVARYGGEEFVVILPNTNAPGALRVAEKIRAKVGQYKIEHTFSEVNSYVTLSLGVASMIPELELSPESLVAAADMALYEAKNGGRDRVVLKTFSFTTNDLD